ncbi:MAG: TIM barrel protein [Candidatus Bathyarchaeia archaeon]
MPLIRLGPAGVPTVCKTRSTVDGVKTVHELGLQAMEVEFVRGVNMKQELAEEVGMVARALGVQLSIHAPYYINLCSEDKKIVADSKKRILDSAFLGEKMNARIIAIHAAYYGKLTAKQALTVLEQRFGEILDYMKSKGWRKVKLGLETTGRVSQFGTLEELLDLSREVDCVPYVDFAHVYARQAGRVDYADILDKLEPLKLKESYIHFAGMNWTPVKGTKMGNEKNHMEIGTGKPPFEPLAKELLKRRTNTTIICESPTLEQDSLVMKKIFRKLGYEF